METMNFAPPTKFDVSIYGEGKQVSATRTQNRLRIFYTGMNRNRTYISDEFAKELINSLPYTPIKGIFNKENLDYEDHGEDNSDGRIYGIVPENPNFAWENHLDEDGIERLYACCDVYLFTGLYPEASLIAGKPQSMEIFRKTLKGEWRLSEEDGKPYYHFLHGEFVGLQVLGEDVEPCFEGAAFFELLKDFDRRLAKMENKSKEGSKVMDKALFRLSDNEKADILFDLINPNFNEEGNWELTGMIAEVYEDYALTVSPAGYSRTYYTKDGDNVTIGETVPVKIVDVTESEYTALETMKSMKDSFEALVTDYSAAIEKIAEFESEKTNFESKIADYEAKIADYEAKIAEFNSDENEPKAESEGEEPKAEPVEPADNSEYELRISELEAENIKLNSQLSDITSENTALAEFKMNVEKQEKEAILSKYEEFLSDESISNYRENIDKFTVEDFKKEICTEVLENQDMSNNDNAPNLFYKGDNSADKIPTSGALALLNKKVNGGNK